MGAIMLQTVQPDIRFPGGCRWWCGGKGGDEIQEIAERKNC